MSMFELPRRGLWGVLGLLAVCAAGSASAEAGRLQVGEPVAVVDVPGAATRNYPFFSTDRPLAVAGYVEEERFLEGLAIPYSTPYGATVFEPAVATGPARAYKTRLMVRRPADPARFNGVVVLEWLNVSNRFEADNIWLATQEHLVASGYAWVGVSAQGFGGVESLKAWSPERYGGLHIDHGGRMTAEPLSLDIFRQAGAALRSQDGAGLLGGLSPRAVIAAGQSQSAIWLASYINAGLAVNGEIDAFLLVSATGAQVDSAVPVPVLRVVAEGDAAGPDAQEQPEDSARFRQWEVAGASHVDRHLRAAREPLQLRDMGVSVQADLAPRCEVAAIGTTTHTHMVLAAGLDGLARWAQGGPPLVHAPRLQRRLGAAGHLARDVDGLAMGGIRLPDVAAPLGQNVGQNAGAPGCAAQGYFKPYSLAMLRTRYPSHDDYWRKVERAVRENVRHGHLLPADGERLVQEARRAAW